MRKFILGFLLIISLLVSVLPSIAATIPPDIKKAVTFIFLSDAQGNLLRDQKTNNPVAYGTGFFVVVKNENGDGLYGYLVTAKHVLKAPDGTDFTRIFLRLNKLKGDAEFIPLDLIQEGHSAVYTHSDPTVDIAVVPAFPNQTLFDFKVITDDMLTDKTSFSQLNIGEGSEVFFAGLFTNYYGDHRNNPIVRFGRVAMLPEDRIAWQDDTAKPPKLVELYLLETQSYGGNSGSPVFFNLGSDRVPGSVILGPPVIKLAGIMRGSFNETRAVGVLQLDTARQIPITSQNIGIAAVTPSYLLHEILFSDELKKFRAQHPLTSPGTSK